MHALPGNAQLSCGAGLPHLADPLFDFLVMLQGLITAGGKPETARVLAHRADAHM